MKSLKHSIEAFLADEDGASAVEYGLLVAVIVAVVVVAAKGLGSVTSGAMTDACNSIKQTGGTGTC
jgi:pilus assembly protein Flp/PilA